MSKTEESPPTYPHVAVVTGAGGGIGAATAVALGALGATVVLSDLPGVDVAGVARSVEDAGGSARGHPVDIRDFATLAELARVTIADLGHVGVLVANAGIDEQSTIASGDPATWHDVLDTNLLGTVQTVRAFLPSMIERDEGHIVMIGSISGRIAAVGNPVYATSKWGLVGFARTLRRELQEAGSGVHVTLVDPGLVDTPLSRSIPALAEMLEAGAALLPEDVARLVSFVVTQPDRVSLPEISIAPVLHGPPPTIARRAKNRVARMLGADVG